MFSQMQSSCLSLVMSKPDIPGWHAMEVHSAPQGPPLHLTPTMMSPTMMSGGLKC